MLSILNTGDLSSSRIVSKTLAKKLPVPVAKSRVFTSCDAKPLVWFSLVFSTWFNDLTIKLTIGSGV